MPLLVTPGQLLRRSELYRQLSQLTAAGIGLPQAIEMQFQRPPALSFRPALAQISRQLTAGATFHDAMQTTGAWMPEFDLALLHAGEQSGRLPACFTLLAGHYETAAALLRKTFSSLLYPALLFHMAVFLGPLPELFRTWNAPLYFAKTLGLLLPVYALVLAIAYATQSEHGESWRACVERGLRAVPVFGSARRNLALARLASALEALLAAGVSIVEGWDLAAAASGSPALRRAVTAWKPDVLSGLTPAEAVQKSGVFPDLFCNLYHTGEVTGSLEETLRRLYTLYYDEGARQLRAVAEWTPKLIYLGVALMVAWQVVKAWTSYFDQINKAISF
jgi:type II secretory pathway component PulF